MGGPQLGEGKKSRLAARGPSTSVGMTAKKKDRAQRCPFSLGESRTSNGKCIQLENLSGRRERLRIKARESSSRSVHRARRGLGRAARRIHNRCSRRRSVSGGALPTGVADSLKGIPQTWVCPPSGRVTAGQKPRARNCGSRAQASCALATEPGRTPAACNFAIASSASCSAAQRPMCASSCAWFCIRRYSVANCGARPNPGSRSRARSAAIRHAS